MTVRLLCCASLVVMLAGCDPAPEPTHTAETVARRAPTGKTAEAFDLAAITKLIEANEVHDAKEIEEKINDPSTGINALDLDEDGVTDLVEVIESRDNSKATLELRAIPSSKLGDDPKAQPEHAKEHGVVIAKLEILLNPPAQTVSVHASFTAHIEHDPEVHVYDHDFAVVVEDGTLHVDEGHLFFYLFVFEHEFYLGHYHHHHHHIDVHVYEKPVHYKHKKHKKSKGWKHGKHGKF